jgi:hypothetical protein
VDRKGWCKMSFVVEKDSVCSGLRCVVVFSNMGHRCGYVGVGKDHPLYECDYSDKIPQSFVAKWEKIKEGPIGKRGILALIASGGDDVPRLDCFFDVHGGLTFSGNGKGKYPVESDETWWFGFDCAHCDDSPDYDSAAKYGIETTYHRTGGVPRSLDYVWGECQGLAEQLVAVTK